MTAYAAPLDDIRFALAELGGLDAVRAFPGYEEATPDVVDAVLDEAARLAGEVLAPLNQPSDRAGCRLEGGAVRTPAGTREAYRTFAGGGWHGLAVDTAHGGQGLPWLVATAVQEMWQAADMAFALCPMLTQAAIEMLATHGTDSQRRLYLPKLIAGEWSGTMNLTEPQAGSDLGAVRTRAVRDGDRWRLKGQKIFITYGDHDLADNIVHMVLARTEGAPAGTKGLSVFLVPKVTVGPDGALGPPNDVRCVALEHKLGINASPTAVMAYGEGGGAAAELVGEECRGIECMFTMMNNARLAVAVQGLGIAERAYQQARAFARERIQGRPPGGDGPAAIVRHPDVRRMLMTMKAQIAAMRGLIYRAAAALDGAKRAPGADARARWQAEFELLTPVVKAWATDLGVEIASLGVQVHGGMGYIEETGAAQHLRDARINPIYEGTNGIQAADLVRRKLVRDEGAAARAFVAEMRAADAALATANEPHLGAVRRALAAGLDDLERATEWLVATYAGDPALALAGATPYLRLFGTVAGGWQLARAGLAAQARLADGGGGDPAAHRARLLLAHFYADNVLAQTGALAHAVTQGGETVTALDEAWI